MSPKRNIIQVVLPEDVYSSIVKIARLTDSSLSGFVAQILKGEKDTLAQLAQLLQDAQEAKGKLSLSSQLNLDQLMMKSTRQKAEIQSTLDRVHTIVADAKNSPEPDRAARSGGRAGREDPLAINKGAKTSPEGGKRPTMSRDWQRI